MAFFSVAVGGVARHDAQQRRIVDSPVRAGRQQRSAESTMDAAINNMRYNPAAGAYDAHQTDCTSSAIGAVQIDGETPKVSCVAQPSDGVHLPEWSTRKTLTVVGTGTYNGSRLEPLDRSSGSPSRWSGPPGQGRHGGRHQVGGSFSQGRACQNAEVETTTPPACSDRGRLAARRHRHCQSRRAGHGAVVRSWPAFRLFPSPKVGACGTGGTVSLASGAGTRGETKELMKRHRGLRRLHVPVHRYRLLVRRRQREPSRSEPIRWCSTRPGRGSSFGRERPERLHPNASISRCRPRPSLKVPEAVTCRSAGPSARTPQPTMPWTGRAAVTDGR